MRTPQIIGKYKRSEGATTYLLAQDEEIDGGVSQTFPHTYFTLYLKTSDTIDITIEVSPSEESSWFEISKSPLSYTGKSEDVVTFSDVFAHSIKLTGSNEENVTAILYGTG